MKWISINDDLPRLDTPVLAFNVRGLKHKVIPAKLMLRGINAPNWYPWMAPTSGSPLAAVTHWMPLPKPPAQIE